MILYFFSQCLFNLNCHKSNFKKRGLGNRTSSFLLQVHLEAKSIAKTTSKHIAASRLLSAQSFSLLDEFYGTFSTCINLNQSTAQPEIKNREGLNFFVMIKAYANRKVFHLGRQKSCRRSCSRRIKK